MGFMNRRVHRTLLRSQLALSSPTSLLYLSWGGVSGVLRGDPPPQPYVTGHLSWFGRNIVTLV